MYNKLWTKILDSSIWLESDHVRLVWITFLAVMDKDGIVRLSGIGNVAVRARVSDAKAEEAIKCLEAPDLRNPDQEFEGRRIERIPGEGWLVLNAEKYRDIATAEEIRARTRERVRKHREKNGNAPVTHGNDSVTPSEAGAEAVSSSESESSSGLKSNQSRAKSPAKPSDRKRLIDRAIAAHPKDDKRVVEIAVLETFTRWHESPTAKPIRSVKYFAEEIATWVKNSKGLSSEGIDAILGKRRQQVEKMFKEPKK